MIRESRRNQIHKQYFIDPFGCVKNQVDAENMMAHLNSAGWENVSDAEQADLIIVNSCGFIESAKKESINAVLEWRKLYPNKKILLAGCLAERYEKELVKILPEADAFMGVNNPAQITEKVPHTKNHVTAKDTVVTTGERPLLSMPGSAYVKISEGCSNNCSYCAIPLIRGALVCRPIPDIIDECRALLNRGIKELCIIGQDIGAYKIKEDGLPELLRMISEINGDFWVRLLYIHPDHFPLEILDLMEKDKRFLPYFDIPFQHASPKILTAMNRHGTAKKNLELIKTIRARLPNAVIRSTFLLGFPGETEEDFNELLRFQQKAKIDWLGCFTYSREEGTASYIMKGRVAEKIAKARKKIIEEQQVSITEKSADRFIGQTLDVLMEEQIDDIWLGRFYCHAPDIDGSAVITGSEKTNIKAGDIIKCRISARRGIDLEGRIL